MTSTTEQVIFIKDDTGQLQLKTEAQDQCRNIYTLNDVYVLHQQSFHEAPLGYLQVQPR